jgi:predicted RND superfamily exporter protein
MYYLALLIVQCILMGATIDWGILFASYFRETRPGLSRREALTAAYNGSIHTILTSSLVVVLVTGSVGFLFENPTIGEICLTIAKGALCASVLIIFVLPGVVAAFDKLINRRKKTASSA